MFEKNAVIAVAVSGGPDSMALLHLLHSVSHVIAVTVDHKLRAESAAEAQQVAAWCKQHKIEHHILHWQGDKPKTGTHEAARAARYALLQDFCRARRILHLATAHHADDNAETILQRIAKASGPQGLAGMQEHSFLPHLHLWRPLLQHRKAELIAYCDFHQIPYASDPSNENQKFARGRLRGAVDVLAAEGLTAQNLNLLAQKQRWAAEAIADQAAQFLARHTTLVPAQRIIITQDAWCQLPAAAVYTVLDYVLKLISGSDTPIRHNSMAQLHEHTLAQGFKAKTLGHCRVQMKRINRHSYIVIMPETTRS